MPGRVTHGDLARMFVEHQALTLSSLSETVFADAEAAGCEPRVVAGIRAAHLALHAHIRETDVGPLDDTLHSDVRSGLAELDAQAAKTAKRLQAVKIIF